MFRQYFRKKKNFAEKIVGAILMIGGIFLVLIYIPIWAWVAIFGLFLVVLGFVILSGWR